MSSSITSECFINGVVYKCRTCFDPGQTIYPLTDEASKTKTWRDFLMDLTDMQTVDNDLLPNTVCNICLEKLKSTYDFILQIENVNTKYSKLLEGFNDPLREGLLNDIDITNCLDIDMPLELDTPKVKLEEELIDPYNIDLNKNNEFGDSETKYENEAEGDADPFLKMYDDLNLSVEELREKSSTNTSKVKRAKRKRNRKVVVSTEETEGNEADDKCRQTRNRRRNTEANTKPKECNPTSDENVNDVFDAPIKSNVCPICSKSFAKDYLKEHIAAVHEKRKPYKCPDCEQSFGSKNTLKIHTLKHGDVFYDCEYCDRRFRIKHKLKIHLEIHTTKPELLCPICKRSQKSEQDLEEHVKNHAYKRLQCNLCGKFFVRNATLNDHYNAVHLKLRPYKCQYCELGFGDRKTRRMHERKHHPKT